MITLLSPSGPNSGAPLPPTLRSSLEEELLGYYGMEFCIVVAEPQHGLVTMM